ncbi:rhomboid family intramembrane serine protease [Nitrospirillum iridis]|uniref:Membrane associated rhomboid family serine protease n=1 Tax=Nitrospirillum iridis TaxID=765888 RepID=A0A7X0EDF0_9PROT|nr:membrane associated rhomboid family serine protease [Nitrospirillum iridis]
MGSTPRAPGTQDGLIDFSGYSDAQLHDLQHFLDPNASPLNHANLLAEMARRGASADTVDNAQSSPGAKAGRWMVRLTRRDGLPGWLEAVRRHQPLYGAGSVEINDEGLVLHGRRRTWLGVPLQATRAIPSGAIRNVGTDGTLVQFDQDRGSSLLAAIGLGAGRYSFRAGSAADAQAIARALPATRTEGFDDSWAAVRQFDRAMEAAGGPWVTVALVLINILAYAAMAWASGGFSGFNLQSLVSWGGNFGVMTANGQWWRLFTALFMHLDPLHLIVNMWALWNVGRLTERLYGRWLFLALYLATGLLGGLASVIWDPARVCAGASGAIFGLFGLFVAYLSQRRTRLPRAVFRAHWLSTSVFVLFSLTNGAMQTGIDNAAHVGGLLAGLALGLILAQPLAENGQARLRPVAAGLAVALLIVTTTAGILRARNDGARLSPLEQYWQSHQDLARDNAAAERRWAELASRLGGGTLSVADGAAAFESEVVPAWQKMADRLRQEKLLLPPDQARAGAETLEYTENRLTWARKLVVALKANDNSHALEFQDLNQKNQRLAARLQWRSMQAAMAHRPAALSNNTLVTYIRDLVRSGGADCIHGPEVFGRTPKATDARDDGPALRDAAGCAAQRALRKGDYAALEAMMADGLRTIGDLPDGGSRLQGVLGGLNDLFDYEGLDIDAQFARIAGWRRAYPQSIYPDLAEAELLSIWAWWARGHGTANMVSGQAMAVFEFRQYMTAVALEDIRDRAKDLPAWYAQSMQLSVSDGSEAAKTRTLFNEGNAKFPHFYELHRQMLRALMPRWGGSAADVDHFIQEVVAAAPEGERDALLARLYWSYATLEDDDYDVVEKNDILGSRLMAGFDALLKRYPKSDYWLNAYANMACRTNSAIKYIELRPDLDKRRSSVAWSETVSIDSCDKKFDAAMTAYRRSHPDWQGPAAIAG